MRRSLLLLAVLCWGRSATAEPAPTSRHGRFDLVTYNVAGLPEGLSAVRPTQNLPLIGAALGKYDLAFIQEDYAYPLLLRSRLRLPYQSQPFERGQALHFGDGLSNFGKLLFGELRRVAWRRCHGVLDSYSDCLTPKGLAMTRVELAPGIAVDAYNVHLDAGPSAGDVAARAEQLEQLFELLGTWSSGRAVLVAGDFNLTLAELGDLRRRAAAAGLSEACDKLRCGQPWRLDRVLFRGDDSLSLRARRWALDRSLTDERGGPLSDHLAVVVGFEWRSLSASR